MTTGGIAGGDSYLGKGMDPIATSDSYNSQCYPYFPPPGEVVEEALEERIQAWKEWGADIGCDHMQIAKLSLETSLTGVPPFRMKINVNTNIDGEVKRLNDLSSEEYDTVSGFVHNGAKSAAYRIITVDRIGNVPADLS
eukprot:2398457-Karenia_brevis.AAC.1